MSRVVVRAGGRRTGPVREWPLLVVLVAFGLGLLVIRLHHFRIGSVGVSGAMLLAAALRLVLPPRVAGLLVVRSRGLDVALLAILSIVVFVFAIIVPASSP